MTFKIPRRQIKFLIGLSCFLVIAAGCSTTSSSPTLASHPKKKNLVLNQEESAGVPVESVKVEPEAIPQKSLAGKVLLKGDFDGVINTDYVDLSVVDLQDLNRIYLFRLEGNNGNQMSGQNVQRISRGYFLMELPAGSYAFRMISIPVGSSMASEPINVMFDVRAEQITYGGTLKVVGTKEKIKLGGVPVIQPGFEYTVNVLNEKEEALARLKEFLPDQNENIEVNLMRVKPLEEDSLSPTVSLGYPTEN